MAGLVIGSPSLHINGESPLNQVSLEPSQDHTENSEYPIDRPSKRRKVAVNDAQTLTRPVSPPWKVAAAEGPTSFVHNGRRKSSRTNQVPLDLQDAGDERAKKPNARISSASARLKPKSGGLPSIPRLNGRGIQTPTTDSQVAAAAPLNPIDGSLNQAIPRKRGRPRKIRLSDGSGNEVPPIRKTDEREASDSTSKGGRSTIEERSAASAATRHRRQRSSLDKLSAQTILKPSSTRLRLRLSSYEGPVVTNPSHVSVPRKHSSFVDWYQSEDSRLPDDPRPLSIEEIAGEASVRNRLFQAAQPKGVLHQGVSQLSLPEEQTQPPKQYAHRDHLITRAVHFQKLMQKDRRERVVLAKRTALACLTRYGQLVISEDDLEFEEENRRKALYTWILRSMQLTWAAARTEVEELRLEHHVQEQSRLSQMELKDRLDKHQAYFKGYKDISRAVSADSDGSDLDGSSQSEDDSPTSSNASTASEESDVDDMSSSESDGSNDPLCAEDADLTVEQLRFKYKSMSPAAQSSPPRVPSLPSPPSCTDYPSLDKVDDALMDDFEDESSDLEDTTDDDEEDSSRNSSDQESSDDESDSMANLADMLSPLAKSTPAHGSRHFTPVSDEKDDKISAAVNTEYSDSREHPLYRTPQSEEGSLAVYSRNGSTAPDLTTTQDSEAGLVNVTEGTSSLIEPGQPTPGSHSLRFDNTSKRLPIVSTSEWKHEVDTPVPTLLRGKLRDYQHEGLDWLAKLYQTKRNGILADEMGLGKTIQSIALLAHLACEHHVWGPHLVVVPTSVILNWEMEFKKWCPGFKILTYYGDQKQRKKLREGWTDDDRWNVCITSYNIVGQDKQVFRRRRWQYFILDEAHNIKNFRSQKWQTLISFNTRARLLLTGTPLQNSLEELWSLMFFLMPSMESEDESTQWFQLQKFQELFGGPARQIMDQGKSHLDMEGKNLVNQLHELLRPYLLRRLKSQVEKQMPQKHEHIIMCRLSKRQRELYDGFMGRARTKEQLASGNTISVMNALMQLRKVCNHPDLFETRPIKTSWALSKSAVIEFEIKDFLLRRNFLKEEPDLAVSLEFMNLIPAAKERSLRCRSKAVCQLNAVGLIGDQVREVQGQIKQFETQRIGGSLETHSVESILSRQSCNALIVRLHELQHQQYIARMQMMSEPLLGVDTRHAIRFPLRISKDLVAPQGARCLSRWYHESNTTIQAMVSSILDRAQELKQIFHKFVFVTPEIVIPDILNQTVSGQDQLIVQDAMAVCPEDPYSEPRIRQAIAFPDKRLLQFDCGKLQKLDSLLRTLQAGGHRALIFTQMTRVLDILEQFLNIHGHLYLRLDGSTKVEQRQILTDRFNNDPRILCFILSSRSGGLGINLTGADTVIFYDMDWNPAMDKQCQDRCHRIGQTRDVHIYRFVSEYTIESNILKKANQKRLLDDIMIQQGDFTTDYFNKMSVRDILGDDAGLLDGEGVDENLSKALEEGLEQGQTAEKALELAEDRTDAVAAREARKEITEEDDGNFGADASGSVTPGGAGGTPGTGRTDDSKASPKAEVDKSEAEKLEEDLVDPREQSADGVRIRHVDEYMVRLLQWELKDVPVVLPDEKAKRNRRKRKR